MYKSTTNSAIPAVPLYYNQINKGPGTYFVRKLIHCETDCELTLHFNDGDVTYLMTQGEDRGYSGSVTVVSGSITYN